jgi:hypothetical protein
LRSRLPSTSTSTTTTDKEAFGGPFVAVKR